MRLFEELASIWCSLFHKPNRCKFCTVTLEIKQPEFDWLKHYGPLWEPATTAFWLAPDSEAEVEAWYRKYRPTEAQKAYGGNINGTLMQQYQNVGLLQSAQYQNALRNQYNNQYGNIFKGLF